MFPAGKKAKHLSTANHTIKTNHHHHQFINDDSNISKFWGKWSVPKNHGSLILFYKITKQYMNSESPSNPIFFTFLMVAIFHNIQHIKTSIVRQLILTNCIWKYIDKHWPLSERSFFTYCSSRSKFSNTDVLLSLSFITRLSWLWIKSEILPQSVPSVQWRIVKYVPLPFLMQLSILCEIHIRYVFK